MNNKYAKEFKIEVVKRIETIGESKNKVAKDSGVKQSTMHGWVK